MKNLKEIIATIVILACFLAALSIVAGAMFAIAYKVFLLVL